MIVFWRSIKDQKMIVDWAIKLKSRRLLFVCLKGGNLFHVGVNHTMDRKIVIRVDFSTEIRIIIRWSEEKKSFFSIWWIRSDKLQTQFRLVVMTSECENQRQSDFFSSPFYTLFLSSLAKWEIFRRWRHKEKAARFLVSVAVGRSVRDMECKSPFPALTRLASSW